MIEFKPGDRVWVKTHIRVRPLIVKEVKQGTVVCIMNDGQPYPYPDYGLELVDD
jgi:hypothetical protein